MKELSLHILDLVENSIRAKAELINIFINEDIMNNFLEIIIEDDGNGMDEEFLSIVDNPFTTTRKTRNVGLGLPLLKAAAIRTDGDFQIISEKEKGTKIVATFKYDHIDRAPIGNMGSTIATLLSRVEKFDLVYIHQINNKRFTFSTTEVKEFLGEVSLNTPEVVLWIQDYINDNISTLCK